MSNYFRNKTAAVSKGSVNAALAAWAATTAAAVLKAIPANYKLDKAETHPDTSGRGAHINTTGTSTRDMEVNLDMYFDCHGNQDILGVVEIDEAGMGKSKYDLKFDWNTSSDAVAAHIRKICESLNRG